MVTDGKVSWAELPADHPMERVERRRVIGDQAMISRVVLSAGFELEPHSHDNEQFVVVQSGHLEILLADGPVSLRGGDVLRLPGGTPHGARAIEETVVLDVFAPPSAGTGLDAPAD